MKLFELVLKAEEDMQKQNERNEETGYDPAYKISNEIDKQKFYLCSGFSKYYADNDIKSENWEGKNFAAFKFAKAFVKTDIIKTALKDFKIIWN